MAAITILTAVAGGKRIKKTPPIFIRGLHALQPLFVNILQEIVL